MSTTSYKWNSGAPFSPDVYTTRKGESKYLTLRYWDGARWWQIEWHNRRGGEPFKWPKGSRTRFPSSLSSYRSTMTLRRISAPFQHGIQWGEPFKVFSEKEVLRFLVKTGRLPAGWRTIYQSEIQRFVEGGGSL